MGFRPITFGAAGGAGFTLGPVQNVFTGASRAAAETARDAYFTDNPTNLSSYNDDTSLNIRLEFTSGTTATVTYQVRNTAGDAWLDNQSFEGVQGQPGADGTALEFASEAERDTFFQSRPDLLRTNLPVNVFMGGDVVTVQVWRGPTSPPSYDPSTQSVFWIPASVRTGTSSLELGEIHTISSGGENVFFQNSVSDVSYFPPWQSVGDHSTPEGRVVQNVPSHRVYQDLEFIQTRGPALPSGVVNYDVTRTMARNEAIFGIQMIPAEDFTGQYEYRVTDVSTGIVIFNQVTFGSVTDGTPLNFWFNTPIELRSGQQIRSEILKEDGTYGVGRPSTDDPLLPFVELRTRNFTDVPLASSTDLTDHPVTLRRDMPTEADAQALVDASLNSNSALWVTAANQLTSSNRSDAQMFALQAGFLDVDGNPIPTTPVAANTLQLRGGSTVRIIAANEYRIVNSPVLENDIVSAGGSSATTTTGPTDLPVIAPEATNQQSANQAIDGAITTLQNTIFNSGRSFVRFNDGFTIDDTNLATFEDKNIIYTAKNDKPLDSATRPDVNLPTDADIAAAGESYPVTFEFTHLGGTVRSTTSNLVRFFFEGGLIGQILRDDAAVIVKTGVGVDYEIAAGTFNPGDTILPTGVFNLKVDTPISNIATIATELSGVSIVAGDAFLVEVGGSWSGLTIPDNSILVAVVNGPSLLDSAANNDWLLLDNPRVNAKSAALLANFIQDGIRFDSTRNVQVDPSNVFEFSAAATGTPQTREIGTNTQGSGRSITYANVPIQFTDLVGGRLMINLNFNVETVTGFSPSFTSVRLQYPGGIEFTFPVNGTTNNGSYTAAIDIPNVDYTSALNQDCTLTLFYDFFGQSFFGDYTVLGVINTSKGRLHDAISSLIITESVPLETRLQTQIDAITGELGSDEASFAAIQDRISPYRNNVSLSPDINVRYLDSTGSDNFPSVSAMTAVNPLNTEYTMGTTAVFIAVATGVEQAVMNAATQTLLTSANAQTDPNLELGESETFEGRTYFVYRLSNQAISDVIQTFDLTFVQVVAWQDDIDTLDASINRIDAELEHAALNLSDSLIDVLDNNVTVTEESNPTVVATDYNKSFSSNDTQAVFYETTPNAPSGGSHDSEAISVSSSKLVVIPEDHIYSDGVILQANDGATTIDIVNFVGGQLVANVFVPSVPPGSKIVTVHPLPANQVQRDWYSIPLHTPELRAEADELFFTRDVPIAATTLAFQYRYDANGGHGATQTINLVIADISQDASVSASLSLPDGESVNVGFDWQAAQRRIRVTGTPFASDPNFFIFDIEVGVAFTETRTTPATPSTTRPVVIGLSRATGQDAVIATKVSAGGDLILVGDVAEVDTNYAMTTLFGAGLVGNLSVFTEIGTYLNYTQFTPSAQTVVSLENHATLPQFGLFTTEYTHATVVAFDTQLQAHNSLGDVVNIGEELVLVDSGGDRWRLSVDNNGNLSTTKIT